MMPEQPMVTTTADWDPQLIDRGVHLYAAPPGGDYYWRCVEGRYLGTEDSKHHIYFDVVAEDGSPLVAATIKVWNGGETFLHTGDKPPNEPQANFPMHAAGHGYNARVENGPSESVRGMGMGTIEQPYYRIHVSYYFKWQRTRRDGVEPPEPPPPDPGKAAKIRQIVYTIRRAADEIERLIGGNE